MRLKSHWWWDLTAADFARLDMSRIVAVFPIAAVEQHGPHLPVRVDAAINAGVVNRAVTKMTPDFPALILPMLPVGKSDEHIAFPGTLTLSYETLANVWYEIAESVFRAGCRKILFLNSHGGQPQVMEIVCRELRVKLGMFAVSSMWSRFTDLSDLFSVSERKYGIHAGEIETSVMLHLHPDLVDMKAAANFEPLSVVIDKAGGILTPEGAIGFGWQAQDLHPSGAAGNASLADADRGNIAVDRASDRLLELIGEIASYSLERVTDATIYNQS